LIGYGTKGLVQEIIYTPPTKRTEISWQVGGSMRPKNLEKYTKLNWNFKTGGEVLEKIPSMGEVWIFSRTTHLVVLSPAREVKLAQWRA